MEMLPLLLVCAIAVVVIAGMWKTFEKAGQPGWAILIPIYNAYVLCKVAQRPGWWVLLMLVPVVSLVIAIIVAIDVAKHFGKGVGFGLGLAFLAPIFYPILGFSDATYLPTASAAPAAEPQPVQS